MDDDGVKLYRNDRELNKMTNSLLQVLTRKLCHATATTRSQIQTLEMYEETALLVLPLFAENRL